MRTAQVYMRLANNREAVEEHLKNADAAGLSIEGGLRAIASPKEDLSRGESEEQSKSAEPADSVEERKLTRVKVEGELHRLSDPDAKLHVPKPTEGPITWANPINPKAKGGQGSEERLRAEMHDERVVKFREDSRAADERRAC